MEVNTLKKRAIAILIAMLLLCVLTVPAFAVDDNEYSGYKADTLTVEVGYFGGPYYEKHVFSLDELNKMDLVTDDYTFIDNMPAVVIDHVKGVRLSDLMEASGIDLGSVQTFYFWTRDKESSYYTSFTKTALIDTPRYCYYSLPDNFDSETGVGNEYATLDARRVDTLIALGDDWNRCIAGATFGSDYENLNTNTRFRLIYGQTDAVTHTADRSAKWIHKIVVELGGAPTLTLDKSVLDLKVGSVYRAEARVNAADPVIAAGAKVVWSSSDESVATVDSSGSITVHKEGTAVITANLNGVIASMKVTGTAEPENGNSGGTGGANTGQPGSTVSGGTAGQATQGSQNSGQEPNGNAVEIKVGESTPSQSTPNPVPNSPDQNDTAGNSILPANNGTVNSEGGVQNWRVYEMAPDAVELPIIKENNSLMPVIAVLAICLTLGGVIFRIAKFKYDIGDKAYVVIRKPK